MRRALEVDPNSASTLMWLAFAEAGAGLGGEAKAHALLALRLSPRDIWIGNAQLALATASYCAREYLEAVHWAELAIQSLPTAPIRRAIMIACCARAGDLQRAAQERAAQERAALDGFAPDFIASLFRGENRVFTRPEDMEHRLEGLRAGGIERMTETATLTVLFTDIGGSISLRQRQGETAAHVKADSVSADRIGAAGSEALAHR